MSTVRRATPADAPVVAALNPHVQDLHVVGAPDRYRPTDPAAVLAHYEALLAEPQTTVLVAVDAAATVIGYVVALVVDKPGTPFTWPTRLLLVDQIAVHADHRGRGVGRQLMDGAHQLAVEAGCQRVILDVAPFNTDALAFYERLGFAPQGYRLGRRVG